MSSQPNSPSNPTQTPDSPHHAATSGSSTPDPGNRYLAVPVPRQVPVDSGYNTDTDSESNAPEDENGNDTNNTNNPNNTEDIVRVLLTRWDDPNIGGESTPPSPWNIDDGSVSATPRPTRPTTPVNAGTSQSTGQSATSTGSAGPHDLPSDNSRP